MNRGIRIDKTFCGIFFLAAAALVVVAAPVQAQSAYSVWRDRRAEFDAFMIKHPKASTELQQNPQLVYNSKWLDKHPEVDRFLKKRPELREALANRPGLIYRSHAGYDQRFDRRYDRRYDRQRYDRFDRDDRRWGWQNR